MLYLVTSNSCRSISPRPLSLSLSFCYTLSYTDHINNFNIIQVSLSEPYAQLCLCWSEFQFFVTLV